MTLEIEKVFGLVNHLFLITALEKYAFKEDFIKWIQILIQNQESCVINGGTTTTTTITTTTTTTATTTSHFKTERNQTRWSNFSIFIYTCFRNCIFINHVKWKYQWP